MDDARGPSSGCLQPSDTRQTRSGRGLALSRVPRHAARAFAPYAEAADFPTLYDPVLIAMSPQAFTLTGFERVEGVDYAQSWLVTTMEPQYLRQLFLFPSRPVGAKSIRKRICRLIGFEPLGL